MTTPIHPGYSANGKKSRKVSPWNRGPMCESKRAQASYARYCKQRKSK